VEKREHDLQHNATDLNQLLNCMAWEYKLVKVGHDNGGESYYVRRAKN